MAMWPGTWSSIPVRDQRSQHIADAQGPAKRILRLVVTDRIGSQRLAPGRVNGLVAVAVVLDDRHGLSGLVANMCFRHDPGIYSMKFPVGKSGR